MGRLPKVSADRNCLPAIGKVAGCRRGRQIGGVTKSPLFQEIAFLTLIQHHPRPDPRTRFPCPVAQTSDPNRFEQDHRSMFMFEVSSGYLPNSDMGA